MQSISYERPGTLDEAVAILDGSGLDARLLAGGTDLIVALREGKLHATVLVDAKRIPELRPAIDIADGLLSVSADTVLTDIAADSQVRTYFPALAAAAGTVGAVQIRNRATLAGNICNASPAADTAPPLLAYAADVVAYGPAGRRRIPIDEFFLGPGETALARGELVTAIEVPLPDGHSGSAFGRLTRRRGADLASVSVAAYIDGSGRTRLGLGAVGPRPLLAIDETGLLADPAADPVLRASLLTTLAMAASPISDVRASREYRMSMLLVLGQRVLGTAIAERAEGWS